MVSPSLSVNFAFKYLNVKRYIFEKMLYGSENK